MLFVGQDLDPADDLAHAVITAIIEKLLFVSFLDSHPELQHQSDQQR
jgi:hypothetical protein